MYLQAGGSARGIFSGHDDDPVWVGEYTHTGNFTPARRGDDQPWIVGEYTHFGASSSSGIAALTAKVQALSDAQFKAAYAAVKAKDYSIAKGTGLSANEIKKVLIKDSQRRAAGSGGGGGGGDSGSGFLGTGLSATTVIGGAAVFGVAAVVLSKMGGGARSNPGRGRRRRRR